MKAPLTPMGASSPVMTTPSEPATAPDDMGAVAGQDLTSQGDQEVVGSSAHSILLVEDEERLLAGLVAVMKRAGFRVLTATNGNAGLQLARRHRPDVIVSDVMMPPPDGFKLRELLAASQETASIPFLFLTARAALPDKLRGIEGGADDYITKPFDRQELVARVKAVLRRRETSRREGQAEMEPKIAQLRQKILGSVSMQMQRPIAGLLTTLQQMLSERFEHEPPRLGEFIDQATGSAGRLASTIKDLQALAVLEQGETGLVRLEVDTEEVIARPVAECLEYWQKLELRDIEVKLLLDPKVKIHADTELFPRAVHHLIDNACKFSPEGGLVKVDLLALGQGGCVLTVRDQGPGVPAAFREEVFSCFAQIPGNTTRLYGGLGVGLTIARKVARAYGGHVVFIRSERGCSIEMLIPPGPAYASDTVRM